MLHDSDKDLKAAAELAIETHGADCTLIKVGLAIREMLGHRDARSTIREARYALTLVGTERAYQIISEYKGVG